MPTELDPFAVMAFIDTLKAQLKEAKVRASEGETRFRHAEMCLKNQRIISDGTIRDYKVVVEAIENERDVARNELRDATNGWRRQFAALTAERDAANERADAAEALAKERARIIADDTVIILGVTTNLAEVTDAAQDVIDAWNEPERPFIGDRMDILGTALGKAKS